MHDADIRHPLIRSIEIEDPSAVVIEELQLRRGVARADLAAANGSLAGYEIKSERDSLARLGHQVEHYESVFRYSTIVVSARHLRAARWTIPTRWGIKLAVAHSEGVRIEHVRQPRANRDLDPYALVRLLMKSEVVAIGRSVGIQEVSADQPVKYLWRLMIERLSVQGLSNEVCKAIKARHAL